MELKVINHLFDAMTTQIVKPNTLRKRDPFKIEQRIIAVNFLPITIPII